MGLLIALLSMCALLAPVSAARAADSFPAALTAYATSDLAAGELAVPSEPFDLSSEFSFADQPAVAEQSWWPLLYSALIPGLGEVTMGYEKRGIALMAVEAMAWTGYFINHNDGLDERAAYEQFADQHWDMNKWIDEHPSSCVLPGATLEDVEACGRASSGTGAWPGYIPYVSREEDKQHYYENIGKYDWYISGWEDWDPNQTPYARQTDLRTEYRSMRQKSNDSLDTANQFIWVSVAARAFSLVETAIIIHNRRGEEPGGGGGAPVSLKARPRGRTGAEVALEVRFR